MTEAKRYTLRESELFPRLYSLKNYDGFGSMDGTEVVTAEDCWALERRCAELETVIAGALGVYQVTHIHAILKLAKVEQS